jgi:REP element-mobilizing transposase RayT
MKEYRAMLRPKNTYHVYNRANGGEKLFLKETNYRYFLRKFKEYIHPIAEVYSYCLMPNHFHVLLKIRPENELEEFFKIAWAEKSLTSQNFTLERKVTQQFSNFFNAYTKAFNKFHHRLGNLFISSYRRIQIKDEKQFVNTVKYIHHNPVNARLVRKPENWTYSSYNAYIQPSKTLVEKEVVINHYGDMNNFMYMHRV